MYGDEVEVDYRGYEVRVWGGGGVRGEDVRV